MTAGLKPYLNQKDSGNKWVGIVPAHWEVTRLGRLGIFSKGRGGNKEDEVPNGVPCVRYGDLYSSHQYFIHESRSHVTSERAKDYTPIKFGDVLFAGSGETIEEIGKSSVNLMRTEARCGGDVILFRASCTVDAKFMGYATDCAPAAMQKTRMGRGITVMHIYGDELKRLALALPPLPEQTAIARFLDHANDRTDRYIRAKEKLIALLDEYKQALIHDAVTGRIDVRTGKPYPEYKASGVEWLGEVPGHWDVRRLKACVTNVVDLTSTRRPEEIYVALENVESWTGKIVHVDFYTPFEGKVKRFRRNDVLFGKLRPCLAKVTCVGREGVCVGEFLVLRTSQAGPLPRYLERWLCSRHVIDAVDASTFGAKMPRADWRFIGNVDFTLPPIPEQTAIASYLDSAIADIANSIDRASREICLLREYRTRLIADVVTGKLDVREAAADLPDSDALKASSRSDDSPTGGEGREPDEALSAASSVA